MPQHGVDAGRDRVRSQVVTEGHRARANQRQLVAVGDDCIDEALDVAVQRPLAHGDRRLAGQDAGQIVGTSASSRLERRRNTGTTGRPRLAASPLIQAASPSASTT